MSPAVAKVVILHVTAGSSEEGFQANVEIAEEGRQAFFQQSGRLPALAPVLKPYTDWQQSYYALGVQRWRWVSRIIVPPQTTNVSSIEAVSQAGEAFEQAFQLWLDNHDIQALMDCIIDYVRPEEAVRVILKTDDRNLQRLPWHRWKLFKRRHQASFVLAAPYMPLPAKPLCSPLRILSILGLSEGIEVVEDWNCLRSSLPNASLKTLQNPTLETLVETLWAEPWDILFFAGHSHSNDETGGSIYLGARPLPLQQLQDALRGAVRKGLKLAIFNSCDGLGLAQDLGVVRVPNVIVMREPVPDVVARDFLRFFLQAFCQGESFHLAVCHARERLKIHEEQQSYPQASWLPVIFQSPSARPWHYKPSQKLGGVKSAAACAALALLMLGIGWLYNQIRVSRQVAQRFSYGEDLLLPAHSDTSPPPSQAPLPQPSAKQKGVEAFRQKRWSDALEHFQQARVEQPSDPETLIYLNNAQIAYQEAPHVTVVASVPIGSNSNVAQEMLRGVAQAQWAFNRKLSSSELTSAEEQSTGSIMLRVAIANDENDSDISRQLAQHFVSRQELLAVIGHNATNATMAGVPVYNEGKIVMITPTSFAGELLYNRGRYPYAFRLVPSMQFVSEQLSDYILAQGHRTVALCVDWQAEDNASFAEAFRETFQRKDGVIVPEDLCDAATPFRTPEAYEPDKAMRQLIDSDAQAIMIAPHIDRIRVSLQLAQANGGRLPLYGSPSFYTQETLSVGKSEVDGLVLPSLWTPQRSAVESFPKQAMDLWGGPINWRTAMSYDAANILIQVAQQLQQTGTTLSREAIFQVLNSEQLVHTGVTGRIDLRSPQNHQRTIDLLKVQGSEILAESGFVVLSPNLDSDREADSSRTRFIDIPNAPQGAGLFH